MPTGKEILILTIPYPAISTVMAPPVEQCFADCAITTPNWANFLSCTSTDELRNLRALQPRGGNGDNVLTSKALIPIPPKIVTNLAEILKRTTEPHAVLLELIQVYQHFDATPLLAKSVQQNQHQLYLP